MDRDRVRERGSGRGGARERVKREKINDREKGRNKEIKIRDIKRKNKKYRDK